MSTRVNYLNNADLMAEIHKSKTSFSSFLNKAYHQYDIILLDLNDINLENIETARKNRAKRLSQEIYEYKKHVLKEKIKLSECAIDPSTILTTDLIFRVMTYDHIPLHPGRKKTPKTIADHKEKINFPPFQHWKLNDHGELLCVGKSHWKGDVDNGYFCKTHGQITDKLAKMYMKLCDKYSTKGNINMYTYLDEMKGNAILQLINVGLQFNEYHSSNPFSYLSSVITNAQVRVINVEKRNQVSRDELLESNGLEPSFSRTIAHEHEIYSNREIDPKYKYITSAELSKRLKSIALNKSKQPVDDQLLEELAEELTEEVENIVDES